MLRLLIDISHDVLLEDHRTTIHAQHSTSPRDAIITGRGEMVRVRSANRVEMCKNSVAYQVLGLHFCVRQVRELPRTVILYLIFKDVSREFDEFQVNTHLCKLRCWYS